MCVLGEDVHLGDMSCLAYFYSIGDNNNKDNYEYKLDFSHD